MASAAVTPKVTPVDKDEGVFLQRGAELKEEGNKAYNMRDMRAALALYEQARSPATPRARRCLQRQRNCAKCASRAAQHPRPPLIG